MIIPFYINDMVGKTSTELQNECVHHKSPFESQHEQPNPLCHLNKAIPYTCCLTVAWDLSEIQLEVIELVVYMF